MQLGIIGAGRVSQSFARLLVANGHEVLLSNSRGPQTLGEVTTKLGPKARAVTFNESAEDRRTALQGSAVPLATASSLATERTRRPPQM